jgi:hypothetical protein
LHRVASRPMTDKRCSTRLFVCLFILPDMVFRRAGQEWVDLLHERAAKDFSVGLLLGRKSSILLFHVVSHDKWL